MEELEGRRDEVAAELTEIRNETQVRGGLSVCLSVCPYASLIPRPAAFSVTRRKVTGPGM